MSGVPKAASKRGAGKCPCRLAFPVPITLFTRASSGAKHFVQLVRSKTRTARNPMQAMPAARDLNASYS